MKFAAIGLCLSCLLTATAAASAEEEAELMVSVKRLSMETALAVAQGAIASCRERGIQIGVTAVKAFCLLMDRVIGAAIVSRSTACTVPSRSTTVKSMCKC